MNKPIISYLDCEERFWEAAKEDILLIVKETLQNKKTCVLGLAGGKTPKQLYELLSRADLPWDRIELILIDERYVSSDHPESNLKMLRETLLRKISLPPENLICFDTALPEESAAKEMNRKLESLSRERQPIFDLLILGAGTDGHIASLFEGSDAITSTAFAAMSEAQSHLIKDRLTLTVRTLKSSARAILLLKGPEKIAVVQSLEGGSDALPLTALRALLEQVDLKVLAFLQ